eukprot:1429570-Pyramimonas_sp.AAC.1
MVDAGRSSSSCANRKLAASARSPMRISSASEGSLGARAKETAKSARACGSGTRCSIATSAFRLTGGRGAGRGA